MIQTNNIITYKHRLRDGEDVLWAHIIPKYQSPFSPMMKKTFYITMMVLFSICAIWFCYKLVHNEGGWHVFIQFLSQLVILLLGHFLVQWIMQKYNKTGELARIDLTYPNTLITNQRVLLFNDEDNTEESFERANIVNAILDWENGARVVRLVMIGREAIIVARHKPGDVLNIIRTKLLS